MLNGHPVVVMKLYSRGSLAAAIEAAGGGMEGLEVQRALRWAHVAPSNLRLSSQPAVSC
jgi:hypothetical protein